MKTGVILLSMLIGAVSGAIFTAIIIAATKPDPFDHPVSLAEVSDLIERLKPLAKNPKGEWYSNGIALTFYGKGVNLDLKLPNGNEYHSRADTLREAVSRITEPSVDIQNALKGWNVP